MRNYLRARYNAAKSALMDPYAPGCGVVRLRVAVGNLLFINAGQSVRVVVVFVRVKLAQKLRYVSVELGKTCFPPERHYDMLVDKRRVRDNPGFLIVALVKRHGQRPYLFFHNLFEL